MPPRPRLCPRPRVHHRHAFTLIELLVVISIIAVLIGILLPSLGAARRAAATTKSLAHVQQINLGLVNYATDHKQVFPATAHGGATWMDRIAGYIDEPRAFRSPHDPASLFEEVPPDKLTSYALNAYFSPDHPPFFGVKLDELGSPSNTILVAEVDPEFHEDHFTPMFWGYDPAGPASQNLAYENGVDVTAVPVPTRVDPSGSMDYEHDAEENWDPDRRLPASMLEKFELYRGRDVFGFADGHAALHIALWCDQRWDGYWRSAA